MQPELNWCREPGRTRPHRQAFKLWRNRLLIRNLNNLLDTEKANQTRYSNALDSLAHSLKTPLSVIRSSLPADTPVKTDAVNNAVSDMQHLIATRLQRAAASTRRTMALCFRVSSSADSLEKPKIS